MSDKESLNFYKLSTLLLGIGTNVLTERIEAECKSKSLSFEDLLNKPTNKDTLLHLWQPIRCCNTCCNIKSKTNKVLTDSQWKQLYTNNGITGHVKRDANGRICQSCTCIYTAIGGIIPKSLDITLASCVLTSLCSLSLLERKSIETLRELRNSVFAHAQEPRVTDTDFNQYWQQIESEIVFISSFCDLTTKTRIKSQIDHIKQLPFVDDDTLQTLLNTILLQQGRETCLKEVIEEITQAQNDSIQSSSIPSKVQRITEAEAVVATIHFPTRALEMGISCLKTNGLIIFTGICGSGKSSNSLEIMNRVKEGQIFPEHKIQHINIENWDSQIDVDQNTVVFLEDPLGTTNANTGLILHDQGIFRKILACIQEGKIKVIMTIRSNILNKNQISLKRYDIFDKKYIIDLSSGELALNKHEKTEIVLLYCRRCNIEIVQNVKEEIQKGRIICDLSIPFRLPENAISKIIGTDTPIGFPLCCKYFFENRRNTYIGPRYFSQPTEIMLHEIEDMALSEDTKDRRHFLILLYMVMNKGRIETEELNHCTIREIANELDLPEMKDIHIKRALTQLNGNYISDVDGTRRTFKLLHASVSESVFIKCGEETPKLVPKLLSNVDIKTLCELVRTHNYVSKESEIVFKIQERYNTLLATRFVKELQKGNIRHIVTHTSMTDGCFISVFIEILKKENRKLAYDENNDGSSFFGVACLYDRVELVESFISDNLIPHGMLRQGCLTCIEFDNIRTAKVLLPNMSPEQLRPAFLSSCRHGNTDMVKLFIEFVKEDLLQENIRQGFINLCEIGNVQAVRAILKCGIENNFHRGFEEACKTGHESIVTLLLHEYNILTGDQLISGFVKACEFGKEAIAHLILGKLSESQIQKGIIEACSCGNRQTLSNIIEKQDLLSNETILDCLLTICDRQNEFKCKGKTKLDSTYSVQAQLTTPFPFSIENQSFSVPLNTPATNNINLFPAIETSHLSAIGDQGGKSIQKTKGFLIRSILQVRQTLSLAQIETLLMKACERDIPEVVFVVLELYKNNLSEEFLEKKILYTASVSNAANIVEFLLDTFSDISLEDITRAWHEVSNKRHLQTARLFLDKRQDIQLEDIVKSLYQACDDNALDFVRLVLLRRPGYIEEISKPEILKLLKVTIEKENYELFDVIIRKKPVLDLKEIGQILTETFAADNKNNLIRTFSELYPNLKQNVIEASLFKVLTFHQNNEDSNILKLLKTYVNEGKVRDVEIILKQHKDLPLKSVTDALSLACENYRKSKIVKTILKEGPTLPTSEIHTVFLKACKSGLMQTVTKIVDHGIDLSDEQIYEGLVVLCSITDETITMFIEKRGVTSRSRDAFSAVDEYKSKILKQILKRRTSQSTDQLSKVFTTAFECGAYKICSVLIKNPKLSDDHSFVETFLKERPDLTTDQVCKCLLELCSQYKCDHSNIEIFLKARPDLTTDQVYKCLLELCSHNSCDHSYIEIFLKARPDLTTDQVYKCLLKLCSWYKRDHSMEETFLKERPDLTTDQIYKCLLELCSHNSCDHSYIEIFLKARPDLTTDQVYKCLLKLCSWYKRHHSIVETFLKERPDLTTDQIYECLLKLCSHDGCDHSNIKAFLKERSDLTTEQVYQCFMTYCSTSAVDKDCIGSFLKQKCDLSTQQVVTCVLEIKRIQCGIFVESYAMPYFLEHVILNKPELSNEELRTMYDAFCKNWPELSEKFCSAIKNTRPNFTK